MKCYLYESLYNKWLDVMGVTTAYFSKSDEHISDIQKNDYFQC
jgi:hypothetical protein